MGDKYSLSGLVGVYKEAIDREEPTIVFEVNNGRGIFLFLMFFDEDEEETKDKLFIYMRHINKVINIKLYGNHYGGQFDVYLPDYVKKCFKEELQIESSRTGDNFRFNNFFSTLNNSIPSTLPLQEKISSFRKNWKSIKNQLPKGIVDENDKTIFVCTKKLPKDHKPKEKTLRKLYLYTKGKPEDITSFIKMLKKENKTAVWTSENSRLSKSKNHTDLV